METIWKCAAALLGLLFLELCNGLPVNSENSVSDSQTQFLTGLIGILLTVSTVIFLVGCVCCQRRNGFKEFRDSPIVISSVSTLDNGLVNPVTNGEFTIFSPLSPSHHNNNVFLANQQIVSKAHEDCTAEDNRLTVWFDANEKDFPRTKLKYIRELGKGWFGSVVEGTAQGLEDNNPYDWTPVAVRILEATASVRERAAFLHDALIYRIPHPNILKLLGRSLESIPFLLLQELCPQGDLKGYLREHGRSSEQQILVWCYQLTSALKHLHVNKLTHPDLAARNCMLSSDLQLKLGDYGLSVLKYPEDYYQGAPGVPVRWCAPESLVCTSTTIQPEPVTFEANIWSLGVTLWEICECGEQPYKNLTDDEVVSQVLGPTKVRLKRLTTSAIYTDYMYRLMQLCWSTSESRPSIFQIDVMLCDLLEVCKNTSNNSEGPSADDFDHRWELLKPNTIVKTDNQTVETDDDLDVSNFIQDKQMSPSLNNLLDDGTSVHMESWLENVALKTNDADFSEELSDVEKRTDTSKELQKVTPTDMKLKQGLKVEFKLCPMSQRVARSAEILNDRTSSESETEDENWKRKIERGAYSEKVRQKSRSVTDLMVLTHIDCSESDSETPLPSLDYKANFYKNVRYAPRQNLENVSMMFGSEGNLLSVKNTFQEELQKLREERKDSLLFVPENTNQDVTGVASRRILEELNSTSEMKPANQVFNVFNVTVSSKYKFSDIPKLKQALSEDVNTGDLQFSVKNDLADHANKCDSTLDLLHQPVESKLEANAPDLLADVINKESNLSEDDIQTVLPEICSDTSEVFPALAKSYVSSLPDDTEVCNSAEIENQQPSFDANSEDNDNHLELVTQPQFLSNVLIDITKEFICNESRTYNIDENVDSIKKCNSNSEIVEMPTNTSDDLGKPNVLTEEENFDEGKNEDVIVEEIDEAKTSYTSASPEMEVEEVKSTNIDLKNYYVPAETLEIKTAIENFLEAERLQSQECSKQSFEIKFDLSENQQSIQPNSLTHSMVFTSSPFVKKQLENSLRENDFTSLTLFDGEQLPSDIPIEADAPTDNNLTYSIETWDNFLEKTLESQEECFSSFNSEPQSILFIENGTDVNSCKDLNATYVIEEPTANDDEVASEKVINDLESPEVTVIQDEEAETNCSISNDENGKDSKNWEAGEGWFLHPQSNEDVSGQMEVCEPETSTSYVGFSMDDEIMAAIRNELLQKLPHAQGTASEKIIENEEWDSEERNEVFIRYNVYNTPLSPIPEESFSEPCSKQSTPRYQRSDSDESDWSEGGGRMSPLEDAAGDSCSPQRGRLNRHTPSQDSCCSNDTLFNLEELTCIPNEPEKESAMKVVEEASTQDKTSADIKTTPDIVNNCDTERTEVCSTEETKNVDGVLQINISAADESKTTENYDYITDFLDHERSFCCEKEPIALQSDTDFVKLLNKAEAPPLPSPEDKPWKQLPASLLNYNSVATMNENFHTTVKNLKNSALNAPEFKPNNHNYVNVESKHFIDCDETKCADYVNVGSDKNVEYVNTKNGLEDETEDLYSIVNDDDIGVLGDIRFTGPGDGQLMSTSFSESNELAEEQGWDSGSDTRSSSSGEFIWKEGEHEASVKALHASSCDAASEEIRPMEDIQEESGESCSSSDDDEGDGPEFVPSAWDKYATPTKSALRSPEKTDKKRKSKGVWFKKQKYHCVYEYPREPESPTLQSYDLWSSVPAYNSLDWDLESDAYAGIPCNSDDPLQRYSDFYKNKNGTSYNIDPMFEDFYVSSSAKPFDVITGLTSQFFPGQNIPDEWTECTRQTSENATPDSGVEDENLLPPKQTVLPLKYLAAAVAKKHTQSKTTDVLGGLRHTRNKLKLDLPPSPSAFTSSKSFAIETPVDPIINREVPTFTTFGKSRFLVQHVDTPEHEQENGRNVSFEALPYKPLQLKVEVVTGEASVLDSGDEDSGIESSTLERKKSDAVE